MGFKVLKLAFVVVSLFIACSLMFSGTARSEDYNLGVALGFTGTGTLYSKDQMEGVQVAVDEINAKGGFLGKYPIKVFQQDTQTKPDVGVRTVKDLILRDKVRAVINDYSSAVAVAVKLSPADIPPPASITLSVILIVAFTLEVPAVTVPPLPAIASASAVALPPVALPFNAVALPP